MRRKRSNKNENWKEAPLFAFFGSHTFLLKKKSMQKKTKIGRKYPLIAFFGSHTFSFLKEKVW